jgi:prophage regulatory protein
MYGVEGFQQKGMKFTVQLSQQRSDNMQSQANPSKRQLADVCPACGQHRTGPSPAQVLDSLPPTAYIRQKLLLSHIVPFSPATLWRRVKAEEFPKAVKISARVTGWRVSEVRAWLDATSRK